ncbi:putative amidase [Xylona heveae TC161]|uniref:Putative amidase n=1 Tax=Xylona heveae (strain CBS 132557 / TC161) TaxID=1328760 RepID=A0A165FGH1_XYLHT|nr:putative amidase [Xylona heveae TC161]KZF20949.1 putative amidase [Xylona heveae TC161]
MGQPDAAENWPNSLSLVEANIDDLQNALSTGSITSVELVALYLRRISKYDCRGPCLNSIPLLNSSVFEEAAASDDRRRGGHVGPLEGIPFTVKDSYKVKGMSVASGSPAFKSLMSNEDAFTVEKLREAGAVLIGKTNMPPMAYGGMQRGVYGRAESPYNLDYLTAAFASGSSNGSASSTSASLAAFGMGEETVSSGRSPASNNGLVAYTPSRGAISIRGNWPLYPTCDVVVPHTRTVRDMFDLLNVIVTEDKTSSGDFWREQKYVSLPEIKDIRPKSYHDLADPKALSRKKIGVPRMYIGKEDNAGKPVTTSSSVIELWEQARLQLESLGATVIETDFPVVSNYEKVPGETAFVEGAPEEWNKVERSSMIAHIWNDFLLANGDRQIPSLASTDTARIFPMEPGAIQSRYSEPANAVQFLKLLEFLKPEVPSTLEISGLETALLALENARKRDLEEWLDKNDLDFVVFPANGDVGRADSDRVDASAKHAWQNGVKYSNGNRAIRHLGIPTVSVTMGTMKDTGMPVGLTFASKAYDDSNLLRYAYAYETASRKRVPPGLTPSLDTDIIPRSIARQIAGDRPALSVSKSIKYNCGEMVTIELAGEVHPCTGSALQSLTVCVDGDYVQAIQIEGSKWSLATTVYPPPKQDFPTEATVPRDQITVVVLAKADNGAATGHLLLLD